MTARERALTILARIIAADQDADPDCTARECLVALEGLGYRPTEARPAADWKHHGTGTGPSEETRALMEAARERSAEATTRLRPDKAEGAA